MQYTACTTPRSSRNKSDALKNTKHGITSPIHTTLLPTPYSLANSSVLLNISHDSGLINRCWVPPYTCAGFFLLRGLDPLWFSGSEFPIHSLWKIMTATNFPLWSSPGFLVPRSSMLCTPSARPQPPAWTKLALTSSVSLSTLPNSPTTAKLRGKFLEMTPQQVRMCIASQDGEHFSFPPITVLFLFPPDRLYLHYKPVSK